LNESNNLLRDYLHAKSVQLMDIAGFLWSQKYLNPSHLIQHFTRCNLILIWFITHTLWRMRID